MKFKKSLVFTLALLLPLIAGAGTTGQVGNTQRLTSPDQVPAGLIKSEWASIRAAYDAGRHAFTPTESGWQARNPGQQWLTRFDGRGFVAEPDGGGWQWGLELKRYGFPGAEQTISGVPTVQAEGQRLTYGWDSTVSEWFVNDPRGLEHGFTVRARPAGAAQSPLQFDLAVRGALTARVPADGQGLLFCNAAGATVVDYSGLKVWDADGKILASRFVTVAGGVRLLVQEQDARYPLTIDPLAQQAYLKASNTTTNHNFGSAVAMAGDTLVVGAPYPINFNSIGAAYVFVRNGTTWSQQAQLLNTNGAAGDEFGYAVAIFGDTIVVGAPKEDFVFNNMGAAYVFERSGTNWSQQAKLSYESFGHQQGSIHFGAAVAVAGDTILIGIPLLNAAGVASSGQVRVFKREGETWVYQQVFYDRPGSALGRFGAAIAMSDGTNAVIGSPGVNRVGEYAPSRPPCVQCWDFERTVLPVSSLSGAAKYGTSVAISRSGTTIIAGAPGQSFDGRAYVFERDGTNWSQQAELTSSHPSPGGEFGAAVAVAGDTVAVGAPFEPVFVSSGTVHVFARTGTNWSQQAYFTAKNTDSGDEFGGTQVGNTSLAMSGDTLVVGAHREDSSATGVNGDETDNSATASGAAYVFVPAAFEITSIARTNDHDVLVTWNTSGPTNIVQVSGGIYATNGFTDATNIAPTTVSADFLDAGALTNSAARFYRILAP